MEDNRNHDCSCMEHNHEIQGSVRIASPNCEAHNHRFATVSGCAIHVGQTHVHDVKFQTDTYENHNHAFSGRTGPAVRVGDGHVHFLESVTTREKGHVHTFKVSTLIEDPIEDED